MVFLKKISRTPGYGFFKEKLGAKNGFYKEFFKDSRVSNKMDFIKKFGEIPGR